MNNNNSEDSFPTVDVESVVNEEPTKQTASEENLVQKVSHTSLTEEDLIKNNDTVNDDTDQTNKQLNKNQGSKNKLEQETDVVFEKDSLGIEEIDDFEIQSQHSTKSLPERASYKESKQSMEKSVVDLAKETNGKNNYFQQKDELDAKSFSSNEENNFLDTSEPDNDLKIQNNFTQAHPEKTAEEFLPDLQNIEISRKDTPTSAASLNKSQKTIPDEDQEQKENSMQGSRADVSSFAADQINKSLEQVIQADRQSSNIEISKKDTLTSPASSKESQKSIPDEDQQQKLEENLQKDAFYDEPDEKLMQDSRADLSAFAADQIKQSLERVIQADRQSSIANDIQEDPGLRAGASLKSSLKDFKKQTSGHTIGVLYLHQVTHMHHKLIPPGIPDLLELISKEVLRSQPKNVIQFIDDLLKKLVEIRDNKNVLKSKLSLNELPIPQTSLPKSLGFE